MYSNYQSYQHTVSASAREYVDKYLALCEYAAHMDCGLRAMVDTGECTVRQYQDWARFHQTDALATWHMRGRIGEPCWKTPDWFNHNAGCTTEDGDNV